MTANTVFNNRDSAVRALRKMGVAPTAYGAHLEARDGGKFHLVNIPTGEKKLSLVPAPEKSDAKDPEVKAAKKSGKAPKKVKEPKAAKVKKVKEPKVKKETVAGTVREMVEAGKTNPEIWEVIKAKFKLDDAKKYYPSWYRWNMTRK